MQAARSWIHRSGTGTFAAAALAAVVTLALLTLVVDGLTGQRMPFRDLVVAERACAVHRYVSEREQCLRDFVEAMRGQAVAREDARR